MPSVLPTFDAIARNDDLYSISPYRRDGPHYAAPAAGRHHLALSSVPPRPAGTGTRRVLPRGFRRVALLAGWRRLGSGVDRVRLRDQCRAHRFGHEAFRAWRTLVISFSDSPKMVRHVGQHAVRSS